MTLFFEPRSTLEAVATLAEHAASARIVAGGTDLVVGVNSGATAPPDVLVSVARVEELRGVEVGEDAVSIGAAVTFGEILFSETLRRVLPALPAVAGKIAGPQIRNMATIGGNVGNASPGGDMLNPLLALGAAVEMAHLEEGRVALREVALADFFTGPGETLLEPGELITRLVVPLPGDGWRFAHEKLGRRPAMECAVLAVGVGATVEQGGLLRDVRVVLSGLAPTPLLGTQAQAALEGCVATEDVLLQAAAAARAEVRPIDDVRGSADFRRELTGVLLRRAAGRLVAGEQEPREQVWPALSDGGRCCGRSSAHTGAAPPEAGERKSFRGEAVPICLTVNGQRVSAEVAPMTSLVELLRDRLGLLGTKLGCGEGECGSCTVLLDGVTVNSCLQLAAACDGREVVTIEGLAKGGDLDPVQEALVAHGAVQCGFCTPGMVLQAWWVIQQGEKLSPELAARAIEGNLCRCTGYVKIVEAILAAAGADTSAAGTD